VGKIRKLLKQAIDDAATIALGHSLPRQFLPFALGFGVATPDLIFGERNA
jgi:hypothetical protein